MTPWLDDGDVQVYVGDVRAVLAGLPDESVDCVVTSPPYWGLRDYGTGSWDGGDGSACDHVQTLQKPSHKSTLQDHGEDGRSPQLDALPGIPFRDVCARCGARRVDHQLGLEATPDLYVAAMVDVFRQVRRVLAPHGTCFLNLGDSYWGGKGQNGTSKALGNAAERGFVQSGGTLVTTMRPQDGKHDTLKPKDLVGIPWRVAFALQADGWWLRSEIIWAKPNPMPESVTDRPTKSHEQVFLLSKRPSYWFDAEAVREPHRWQDAEKLATNAQARQGSRLAERRAAGDALVVRTQPEVGREKGRGKNGNQESEFSANPAGRNVRSVWEIATQPFAEAHFATFPEELVRRCLLAGCPPWVCSVCGSPYARAVEKIGVTTLGWEATCGCANQTDVDGRRSAGCDRGLPGGVPGERRGGGDDGGQVFVRCADREGTDGQGPARRERLTRPGVVLDPFLGSGTTALVARKHGRHAVAIELNEDYAEIAARRLQQLSLLGGVA